MNKFTLIGILVLSAIVVIAGCKGEEAKDDIQFKIEGLTLDNYPIVDGSTSTDPLNGLIFCKLFDINYQWTFEYTILGWSINPPLEVEYNSVWESFNRSVKRSQTHQSIINLIDKESDIILVARKMSPNEKNYADAAGISLIETPIALDALVIIVNPENPITSLSIKQIQDIYTGKITNWKEVGGNDAPINPYVRNADSGSQELFESLVMKDLDINDFPISPEMIPTMNGVIETVRDDINSICYTIYYYKEFIQRATFVKNIAVEGIYPNKQSIGNNTFPLTAEVYVSICSDLDKSSMAYKLYKLLQTKAGKEVISESGYVPN